jgi:hypothetical protein
LKYRYLYLNKSYLSFSRDFLEINQSEKRIACGGHVAATGDSCFWLADFLYSSPLKLLGQMNRNLVGSIYGWSSIKSAHFVPIYWQTRCFLPSFRSFGQAVSEENIFSNRTIRNKNCLWRPCLSMDRDEMSKFFPDPSTNMAAIGNSCFWLPDIYKSSPLKPLRKMNPNLVGIIYGRSSVKIRQVMAKAHIAFGKVS